MLFISPLERSTRSQRIGKRGWRGLTPRYTAPSCSRDMKLPDSVHDMFAIIINHQKLSDPNHRRQAWMGRALRAASLPLLPLHSSVHASFMRSVCLAQAMIIRASHSGLPL
jgi:hypothetical protein